MAKQTFTTGQVLTAAQMTSLQQTAMGGGSTTAKTTSYVLTAADAGTVVQMNSASATTITVNTALFAAGDTVQIQNIGTGVCTVTAGTATVNTIGSLALSQYAGGNLYFNTTSAAFLYGVDAVGASAGSTLVKRASFSNVASTTTTFDSVFTSTYANYLVVIDTLYAATTADDLQFQMRYGGTTESGGNYFGSTFGTIYNGTQTNSGTNAGTFFTVSISTGSSTNPGSGLIYFNRVGSGSQTPNWNGQYMDMSSSGAAYFFGGQTQTARVYDGFLVKSASTNITGTISVYGLAK
jgi:hypothetical protein